MSLFENIVPIEGSHVIDEHIFPLFELTGLYQKLSIPLAGITTECIVINLKEAVGKEIDYLLNLVIASGYVPEDVDLTFRENKAAGYLYVYFNIRPIEQKY